MPPTPPYRPSPTLVRVLIGLLCLAWGSTWVVVREGLDDLPPFTSASARFWIAAAAMAVVTAIVGTREQGARPALWLTLALGISNFWLSYGIVYHVETILPSGLVALMWGVFPMLTALSGHLFLEDERLGNRQWFGFALGFGGLLVLFATDLPSLGPDAVPAGLILMLSPIVTVAGTTAVKKWGSDTRSLMLNRNAMLVGAVALGAMAMLTEGESEVRWTPNAIASVVYLALAGTVMTFGLYFWLMRYVAMHKLALIAYVTPAIALFLGSAVRGEPVTATTLAGAGLILGGILLVVNARIHTGS